MSAQQLDFLAPSPPLHRSDSRAAAGISPPRAHRGDPQPSHDAARGAKAFAETHAAVVLAAVRRWPLSTSAELAERVPYDLTETRRRLSDLFKSEPPRVRQVRSAVPCSIGGKCVSRWEVA